MISSNTRHSVAFKLAATALFSLLVVLLATMGIVSGLLWKDFGRLSRDDATQYAAQVRTLVQTFDETAQEQAKRDFSLFKANFPGQFSVAEAPGADGKPEAVLSFQGAAVNGDFEVVDRFSKDSMGAVATIFARTGEDFIRVTTSLKKQDGERAYKTLLDRKHPAYALMNEGKTYIGRASLFGREYMTVYEPIREGNRTIGILFIGSDMGAILGKLDTVMAGQKLFATGAVYAVNLSAGPARGNIFGLPGAGKTLKVDEKDEQAKAWMAALAAVGQAGDLESDWSPRRSSEGDRATRYLAVEHYKPWNWAIVAEAPLTEMMGEARNVLTWLWLGVVVALALLTVVLVMATRRLVGAPVQQLSTALAYLAQGDLTHAVSVAMKSARWPRRWRASAPAWWKAWAPCAPVPTASRPPARKSPRVTRTSRAGPRARRARWSRRPRAWNSWAPPSATTPTAPARPANSPWAPAAWHSRAARWCPRWSAPCRTSTAAARRLPTSSA